jgi:uncharacterized protein
MTQAGYRALTGEWERMSMELDDWLLDIIVCPKCRADLRVDDAASELVCTGCGLAYPVRDNIPVLLIDEARQPESQPGSAG